MKEISRPEINGTVKGVWASLVGSLVLIANPFVLVQILRVEASECGPCNSTHDDQHIFPIVRIHRQ